MSREVVIVGACRTAIGKMGGALSGISVAKLGSIVIKESLKRAGIPANLVDEVFMGCVLQSAQGQNVARQAAIQAGLPFEIPAQTLNIVCGSGLKCVNLAASVIMSGEADIIVAGGMENMSAAPYALDKARFGYHMNNSVLIDTMVHDALWDAFNDYHMGITAENIASKYNISRRMQDEFAARSQQKCQEARQAGKFAQEIVPVEIIVKKKSILFNQDEAPRDNVTADGIAGLSPAFKQGGTVTAANSSGINDGAAAVVVMSLQKAAELGIKPLVKWVAGSAAGVDPSIMGIAPVAATMNILSKTGIELSDIDLIEANEAFAAQSIAVGMDLGWDENKVNVNGGAIALGHPVGASGCRILVSLIYELLRRNAKTGLATLCVGGGMGVSTVVENKA
jgi:acetyl-CoA C-acetyltransferase